MGTAGGAREEEAAMAGTGILRVACCLGLDRTPKLGAVRLVIYWRRENLSGTSNSFVEGEEAGLAMNWAGPF
jgi:hypothetical protein